MADDCCNFGDSSGAPPALRLPEPQAVKPRAATVCDVDAACGCHGGVPRFDGLDPRYKRVLWTVIAINGAMFLTEMIASQIAGSQALKADALDFLADTLTYGLSLAVIGASLRTRATAALFKGLSLSLMAFWVLGSTIYHTIILGLPSAELMGGNCGAGGRRQPGLGADADALQERRRQCAVGLAVFAQRRDRQRGGDDRGGGRLGNRNRVARSWRRGDDGRNFRHVLGANSAAGVGGI